MEQSKLETPQEWGKLRSTGSIASRWVGSESKEAVEFAEDFYPEESLLSCIARPDYPALWHLQEQYKRIRLYREWSFGPCTALRQNQSAHDRTDFLTEGGTNLALVLSHFQGEHRRQLVAALQELFDDIVDVTCPVTSDSVSLFLEERNGKQIPASRLFDGTLRYLCLLAILLHPEPPPLIAIEEPELGLHPDVIVKVAELIVNASQRTQVVVTTHSRMLIDALSDHPSSVIVCEKENGESQLTRLDGTRLKAWLDQYSLGESRPCKRPRPTVPAPTPRARFRLNCWKKSIPPLSKTNVHTLKSTR